MSARRRRWPLAIAGLLLLWLMAGNSVVHRLGMSLLRLDSLPPDLKVGGHLYYTQGFDGLWRHDLRSGVSEQWWMPGEGSLVSDVAVSPDGSQLALAWASPAEAGFQTGSTDLWLMALPKSKPEPLVLRTDLLESWRDPWWSPEGDWLLATHQQVQRDSAGDLVAVRLDVERLAFDGTRHLLLENAEQAALSSDGRQLVFLRPNPDSGSQGLMLARSDGSLAHEMVDSATFRALASPGFTPDDQAIVFSASGERQDRMQRDGAAAGAVMAHGEPWNIWRLDISTGVLSRVTTSALDGPALAWPPDGSDQLAVLAAEGLFLRATDKMWRLAPVTTEGKLAWASAG